MRTIRGRHACLATLCLATVCYSAVASAIWREGDPPEPRPRPGGTTPVGNGTANGSVAPSAPRGPIRSPITLTANVLATGAVNGRIFYNVPIPTFRWSVEMRPAGSVAAIGGSWSTTTFTPDVPGVYRLRATACPSTCNIPVSNATLRVGTRSFDVDYTASGVLFPDFEPVNAILHNHVAVPEVPGNDPDPARPGQSLDPERDGKCHYGKWPGGAGMLNPQWVVATKFTGPESYKLLEGIVRGSELSSDDNFLNHDDHDWKIRLRPDPAYDYMLEEGTGKDNLPVEWEHTHLPARFRPQFGDRASVWGYRIFDCGHGQHAEIHPPVMVAAHRPRAVQIPSDQKFDLDGDGVVGANETVGSGVWVPGIVSDVFANAYSGENTTPGMTHLHQPNDVECLRRVRAAAEAEDRSPTPAEVARAGCHGASIVAPSPLNRVFTYNIILPRSPARIAAEIGMPRPAEAPLYVGIEPDAERPGGPEPSIELKYDETGLGKYYLAVSVDLRGFNGTRYARRISAAWVVPDPDNFGIARMEVAAESVRVHNDSDWFPFDDGDWRLFAGVSSMTSTSGSVPEWAQLIKGSVTSDHTYRPGDSAWDKLGTLANGRFRGDAYVFPTQPVLVSASGVDYDLVFSDDIGSLVEKDYDRTAHARTVRATAGESSEDYSMTYRIAPGGAIPQARLDPGGQKLHERFLVPRAVAPQAMTALNDAYNGLMARKASAAASTTSTAPRSVFGQVADDAIASELREIQAADPSQVDAFLASLRARMDHRVPVNRRQAFLSKLTNVSNAVPAAMWNKHFGDVQ